MENESQSYITFFQQVVDHCKDHFGDELIYAVVDEYLSGNKFVMLRLNLFQDLDELVKFPGFGAEGSNGIYTTEHTVLNITIDVNNIARFYYDGFTDKNGNYMNEYIDVGESLYSEECFSLSISQPEEITDIISYLKFIGLKKDFALNQDYQFKNVETKQLLEGIYLYIPKFSENLVEYEKLRDCFLFSEIQDLYSDSEIFEIMDNYEDEETKVLDDIEAMKQLEELQDSTNEAVAVRDFKLELKKSQFKSFFQDKMNTKSIKEGDIFLYLGYHKVLGYHELIRNRHNDAIYHRTTYKPQNDWDMYLVVRKKELSSYTAIFDFLNNSQEGESFVNELRSQNEIPGKINYLEGGLKQIQYTIETRINKFKLEEALKTLIQKKESLELQNTLTKERIKNIKSLFQ